MNNYAAARHNMVESQIRPNQVTDARLLGALLNVPREEFVPTALRPIAYMDEDVSLGAPTSTQPERRLLAPMPLARLIQLADVSPDSLVLDIGCTLGYSTALLARLADSVVGLECDEGLAEQASHTLAELEIDNAAVVTGPLAEGYPGEGPFDVIVLNGCVPDVPDALLKQLKVGGRLVVILAEGDFGRATLFCNIEGRISQRAAFDVGGPRLPGFERKKEFVF